MRSMPRTSGQRPCRDRGRGGGAAGRLGGTRAVSHGPLDTNVALVLVVIVVAVAANGHRLAGALAAVSAAVWFDFFFARPTSGSPSPSPRHQDRRPAAHRGPGGSQLAARVRRLRVIAITDAGYLARLHDTAELAQSAKSTRQGGRARHAQLIDLLSLRGCRFEYGSLIGHPPRLEQDGTVVWDRKKLGRRPRWACRTGRSSCARFGNGHFYGRFMLRSPLRGPLPPLQARLVVILADQVGATLDTAGNG